MSQNTTLLHSIEYYSKLNYHEVTKIPFLLKKITIIKFLSIADKGMNRTVQSILPYHTATSLDLKTRLDRHKQGTCVSTEDGVPLFLFITWEI